LQEQKTILVDLDVAQGHIGLYLREKSSRGLNKLLDLPEGMLRQEVEAKLVPYNDYLRLLLVENNLIQDSNGPSPGQIEELIETLTLSDGCVVVDCGRGVTAVNRPVLEQADTILVCVQPERVAMAVTKRFLPKLQEIIFPHTQLRAVLLDFGGHSNLPQEAIESFLGYPLSAMIPVRPSALIRSINKSMPLVELDPESNASEMITQLARQIIKA